MSVIKIKLGVYFIPTFGLVRLPIGVNRNNSRDAWNINPNIYPDVDCHSFKDADYGGTITAMMSALEEVQAERRRKYRKLEEHERPNKATLMDRCGITYYTTMVKGKEVHRFGVSLGSKVSTVYIGNNDTWQANYWYALDKAIDRRHAFERSRTIENYWKNITDETKGIVFTAPVSVM